MPANSVKAISLTQQGQTSKQTKTHNKTKQKYNTHTYFFFFPPYLGGHLGWVECGMSPEGKQHSWNLQLAGASRESLWLHLECPGCLGWQGECLNRTPSSTAPTTLPGGGVISRDLRRSGPEFWEEKAWAAPAVCGGGLLSSLLGLSLTSSIKQTANLLSATSVPPASLVRITVK